MSSAIPKRWGIRAQTTVLAVAVVGVAVAIVMTATVLTARRSLADQITNNAEARMRDIVLLAQAGPVPNPVPGRGEDLLVQVLRGSTEVVASSASIEGQEPLVKLDLKPGVVQVFQVPSLEPSASGPESGEGGAEAGTPFLIAAAGAKTTQGPLTIVVAASLDPVQQLVDILIPRMLIGLPLILLVAGWTVWSLTGRALRPVEAIRSEAEAISGASLDRRVPEPGTGDEVDRLAVTMNSMLDRLQSSMNAQRQFVSDASHELKSPVAAIRMMLEVARRDPSGDPATLLDELMAEDERLERIVADLLVLARADEGRPSRSALDIDLDDVVLAEVGRAQRSSSVQIDVELLNPVRLVAEEGRIESLVRNLVENALRHASHGVWVSLGSEGSDGVFRVSDDGPGIELADRERVFDRFVRLDESRGRREGGTGLGLAVARAVAWSLGGDVKVVEPQHGGATFEARIPLP